MTPQELTFKSEELDKFIKSTIVSSEEETFPIFDGIIEPEKYLKAKFKILWILKQPYAEFDEEDGTPYGGDWDLKGLLKSRTSIHDFKSGKPTFKPMIYSSWGILNNFCLFGDMDNVEDDPSMLNALKSVAYINVQKLPGYKHTHPSICNNAYKTYKEILLKQIELINPEIIIGGGTLHHFVSDLHLSDVSANKQGNTKYFIKDNKIYIQAYHPSQRTVSSEQYCNEIILAVKTWAEK